MGGKSTKKKSQFGQQNHTSGNKQKIIVPNNNHLDFA